jgi:hypothetical protein
MSTLVQQHQQTTFRFYPTDHLIAIVDSPVRAEAALRDLLGAGFLACFDRHLVRPTGRRPDRPRRCDTRADRVFCGSVAVEILPSFAAPRFPYA